MKKFLKRATAIALVLGMMVGCSPATSTPTAEPAAATEAPTEAPTESATEAPATEAVELKVVTSYGGDDGNRTTYEEFYKKYEAETGNIVKDDSQTSNETWKTKVLTDFSTNSEPDVLFYFSGIDAKSIVESGKLVDIETIRAEYPEYASNINQAVLDNDMKAVDGKTYAVPVSGYWEGMFINEDLFTQHDVKVPETWAELNEAIEKFKAVDIVPIAVALSEVPHYWFEFLVYNHTGPAGHLSSVPTDPANLPANWVNGLNSFKELYDAGAFPENTNSTKDEETVQLFQDKKAAMLIDGSWKTGAIVDQDNVKLVPFPTIDGGARQLTDMIGGFSMGFSITTKAWENPAKRIAAVEFINTLTSNDAIVAFNSKGAAAPISGSVEVSGSPLLKSIVDVNSQATAYVGAVQDTLKKEAREQLFANIPSIAAGRMTAEEALIEFIGLNK